MEYSRIAMTEHDQHKGSSELSETQLRVRALETVLTEKGYIDLAALDLIIEAYETKIGPHTGARVVAKAWRDPAFKRALLDDGSKAVRALGHESRVGDHLVAVENTPARHNMVVCTLCSCYPWDVLGLPPVWYKSAPYRSRAVKDPRGVLAEFGIKLPASTEIRVWDSTAETRFLVLPMRPRGTEGWSEERLAQLITRDAMIGTGLPKRPQEAPGFPSGPRRWRDGRCSRHGRDGRLRTGRARVERTGLSCPVGRPRAGDATLARLCRGVAHRCVPLRARAAPATHLSFRVLLPALGAGHGAQPRRPRLRRCGRAFGGPRIARRQAVRAQAHAGPGQGWQGRDDARLVLPAGTGPGPFPAGRSCAHQEHPSTHTHKVAALRARAHRR